MIDVNTENPLVTIIVLSWNGSKHIFKCLEYIGKQTYPNIEVIVVDNNSTDGSIQTILKLYPTYNFFLNKQNLGYAAGMNQGIIQSSGDFIIPLNQDVCLHENFVSVCVERILKDNSIGSIGGRVYAWVGDQLTNNLRKGEGEHTSWRKRFQGLGGIVKGDKEAFVFQPSGSLPFCRKEMFDDLKQYTCDYYDEDFETGWEDADVFFRMHLRGWKCLFLPSATGWHVGSGSVGGKATLLTKKLDYQTRILRNRYFTMIKNIPAHFFLYLSPYLIFTEISLIPYFLFKSPKTIFALFSAWIKTAKKLPIIIKKRKVIQKNMQVEKWYFKSFFKSF
jgi:GT2 family glycosyltransferase